MTRQQSFTKRPRRARGYHPRSFLSGGTSSGRRGRPLRIETLDQRILLATFPTAPPNFSVEPAPWVSLDWDAAAAPGSRIRHYVVYRDGVAIGTTSHTAFIDDTASPTTTYSYAVGAVAIDNTPGPLSDAISVSVPEFVAGVNFNGGSATVHGNVWRGEAQAVAAGLDLPANFERAQVSTSPIPAVDDGLANVLQSNIWSEQRDLNFSHAVPSGEYDVYLLVMENYEDGFRALDIEVEGSVVASNIGSLELGRWEAYGATSLTVTDGELDVSVHARRGDPHVMGLAILRSAAGAPPVAAPPANLAPTVAIDSPQDGQTYTSDQTVVFDVRANDPDGNVAMVEFYAGTQRLGQDTTSPYTFSWPRPPVGTHSLTARATDNRGRSVVSSAHRVIVQEARPTLTVGALNQSVTEGEGTAVFRISRSDADNRVVARYNLSGSSSAADFSQPFVGSVALEPGQTSVDVSFTPINERLVEGDETLVMTLVADQAYLLGSPTSAAVTIIDAPAEARFVKGVNFNGNAVVIDGNRWQSQAEAENDGLSIISSFGRTDDAHLTPSPAVDSDTEHMLQTGIWRSSEDLVFSQDVPAGTYDVSIWAMENYRSRSRSLQIELEGQTVVTNFGELSLRAWDVATGTVTVNDGVLNVRIQADLLDPHLMGMTISTLSDGNSDSGSGSAGSAPTDLAPQVTISTLGGRTVFAAGEDIPLFAAASDSDGSVTRVEIFGGSKLLDVDTAPPYQFTWRGLAPGSYQVTARATDNHGQTTTTAPLGITVSAIGTPPLPAPAPPPPTNLAPNVTISTVGGQTAFAEGEVIPLVASASDPDGSVARVEIFADSRLLDVDSAPPYANNWRNAEPGTYQVFARATDNEGNSANSAPLNIVVGDLAPPPAQDPPPPPAPDPPAPTPPPQPVFGGEQIFVAPNGSSNADGTIQRPYRLTDVIDQYSSLVNPGDVVWVLEGDYDSGSSGRFDFYFQGTEDRPIMFMAYPGDRARFNGGFRIFGEHTTYAGLEVTDFDSTHYDSRGGSQNLEESKSVVGFHVRGTGNAIINNYIHENAQGIFADRTAGDLLAYGNVIFNNGWAAPDRPHGHGTYTQNGPDTRKDYRHNIYTRNFGSGFQLYGTAAAQLQNVHLKDNVLIKENFIIGGSNLNNVSVEGMLTYVTSPKTFPHNDFGYGAPEWESTELVRHSDVTIRNNYLMGGAMVKWMEDDLVFTGNTLIKPAEHAHPLIFMNNGFSKNITTPNQSDPFVINNNTYYGTTLGDRMIELLQRPQRRGSLRTFENWKASSGYDQNSTWTDGIPTGMQVFARANAYERGRGYVTVYNWDDYGSQAGDPVSNSVARGVDVSHFGIEDGDVIEVRNAEDPLGRTVTMTARRNSQGRILLDLPLTGWTVDKPNRYSELLQNSKTRTFFEDRQLMADPIGAGFNTLLIRKRSIDFGDIAALLSANGTTTGAPDPVETPSNSDTPLVLTASDQLVSDLFVHALNEPVRHPSLLETPESPVPVAASQLAMVDAAIGELELFGDDGPESFLELEEAIDALASLQP